MLRQAALAYVLVLGACDEIFDIEPLPAPLPSCTDSDVRDDFDSGLPCVPWGNAATRFATMMNTQGHLDITSSAATGYGACNAIALAPVPETGIFVEVSQMHGDAWFGIKAPNDRLVIYAGSGSLLLATATARFGETNWDPEQMR